MHVEPLADYLDDGTRGARQDFHRAPAARGYVHWCGRDLVGGEPLHAYVHASAMRLWVDRVKGRYPR